MTQRLVPELICSDIERSLAFYCELLGFGIEYSRPADRFAMVGLGGAQLMLEQPLERGRLYPRAALEQPYGRGASFEIDVDDVKVLHVALQTAGAETYLPLEEREYQRATDSVRVRQFAVQDPDGYLLRFSQQLR